MAACRDAKLETRSWTRIGLEMDATWTRIGLEIVEVVYWERAPSQMPPQSTELAERGSACSDFKSPVLKGKRVSSNKAAQKL